VQSRPVHPVNECGKLRRCQPHHSIRDRRPLECTVLQPLPEKA
jgi:hypothetical protein